VRVHIGISSGTATVGAKRLEGRAESRWTWTATGSVTNLAARLVQSGHGGEVLISAETARRVGAAWEATSMGPAMLRASMHRWRYFAWGNASVATDEGLRQRFREAGRERRNIKGEEQ